MKTYYLALLFVSTVLFFSFKPLQQESKNNNTSIQMKKQDSVLRHVVLFKFKEGTAAEDIQKVEAAFSALPSKIAQIKDYEWGTNNSPEKHAAGFTHCFMVTFDSEEGRAAYLPHANHLAFVEILMPSLDAPRVLDFWAEE